MRESARHEDLATVLRRQLDGDMAAIGRRSISDVHENIEYSASQNGDELGLRRGRGLKMQTTDRARPFRERYIILDEVEVQTVRSERFLVVLLDEKPSLVAKSFWLEQAGARKLKRR